MAGAKITVQRQVTRGSTPDTWTNWRVRLGPILKGNLSCRCDDQILVFKDKRPGTPVMAHTDGAWKQVGRITRDGIFLGEGMSYTEYMDTPEGQAKNKRVYDSIRERRRLEATQAGAVQ